MKKIFLLCLICLVGFISCGKVDNPVSSAIAREVSKGEGTIIKVASLTNFDWDKFYLFHPYYNKDSIHEVVGQQFLADDEIELGVPEGEVLFVFMKDDHVINYFYHPRRKGDFADFKDHSSFTPHEAIFKVIYDGRGMWGKWRKMILYKKEK